MLGLHNRSLYDCECQDTVSLPVTMRERSGGKMIAVQCTPARGSLNVGSITIGQFAPLRRICTPGQ